jgi:hypothetical protein
MKKLLFLTALVLFLGLFTFSSPVKIQTARLVAKNLYFERANIEGKADYGSINFSEEFIIDRNGVPMYYVLNVSDHRGWVAVSADDRTVPVICYALEGSFGEVPVPENFTFWMKNYENQIAFAIEKNIPQPAKSADLWMYYCNPNFELAKNTLAVSPLLGSIAWDQGCYYNAQCPVDGSGDCNHVWTGCIATAMAQIMKYHAYPTHGYLSHSYTHATYGTLSANFGTATYGWASMPNSVTSSNTEVAEIMKHCGVSVDMNYDVSGSGAYCSDVEYALKTYFIYAASYAIKGAYSDADWNALLKGDLDLSRPILYAGQDPSGGHAFVCDGYQGSSNDYFHFNWGWSGYYNSYNYLDNLIPGGNSSNGNFSTSQEAIIHIYPNPATTPAADFTANQTNININSYINITDQSTNTPLVWSWTVTPSAGTSFIIGTTSSSQNPRIRFTIAGQYTISLTASNSAGSDAETKTNYITVTSGIGMDDITAISAIKVYPNPVSSMLYIETGLLNPADIEITLSNIVGSNINRSGILSSEPGRIIINVSSLPQGLYYVKISYRDGSVIKKVTVIK